MLKLLVLLLLLLLVLLLLLLNGSGGGGCLAVVEFKGRNHWSSGTWVAEGSCRGREEVRGRRSSVGPVEAVQGRQVAGLGQKLEADAGRSLPFGSERWKRDC